MLTKKNREGFQTSSTNLTNNMEQPEQIEQPEQTESSQTVTNKNKNKVFTMTNRDYTALTSVFRALLEPKYMEKNLDYIEGIIYNYEVSNIFDLSSKVLNTNATP